MAVYLAQGVRQTQDVRAAVAREASPARPGGSTSTGNLR